MEVCKRGHPWSGPGADVYYTKVGSRVCRACRRQIGRETRRERRDAIMLRIAALRAEIDRLEYSLEYPPRASEQVLDVLEMYRGEWLRIAELTRILVGVPEPTVRRAVFRLIASGEILRRQPRGGARSPIEVSVPVG